MIIGRMLLNNQNRELLDSLGFEVRHTLGNEWYLICFDSMIAEGYVGQYFQELNVEDLHSLLVMANDNIRLTYLEGKYGTHKDVARFCNWKFT